MSMRIVCLNTKQSVLCHVLFVGNEISVISAAESGVLNNNRTYFFAEVQSYSGMVQELYNYYCMCSEASKYSVASGKSYVPMGSGFS